MGVFLLIGWNRLGRVTLGLGRVFVNQFGMRGVADCRHMVTCSRNYVLVSDICYRTAGCWQSC